MVVTEAMDEASLPEEPGRSNSSSKEWRGGGPGEGEGWSGETGERNMTMTAGLASGERGGIDLRQIRRSCRGLEAHVDGDVSEERIEGPWRRRSRRGRCKQVGKLILKGSTRPHRRSFSHAAFRSPRRVLTHTLFSPFDLTDCDHPLQSTASISRQKPCLLLCAPSTPPLKIPLPAPSSSRSSRRLPFRPRLLQKTPKPRSPICQNCGNSPRPCRTTSMSS